RRGTERASHRAKALFSNPLRRRSAAEPSSQHRRYGEGRHQHASRRWRSNSCSRRDSQSSRRVVERTAHCPEHPALSQQRVETFARLLRVMEARDAINGDVQLARRFDTVTLPRWTAGKEFEQLVLAIVRNLPLREPSVLTVKGLRRVLH